MEILSLLTNEINQNGYNFNLLTKNKIGFLYIAPVNVVPDDCLACDGYVLKIADYRKLHAVIEQHLIPARKPQMNLESQTITSPEDFYSREKILERLLKPDYLNIIIVEQHQAMEHTLIKYLIPALIMMMVIPVL